MTSPFDGAPQVVEDEGQRVFGGYVEPDEAGFPELLTARDLLLERLLRARSQRDRAALVVEAACHGLVVEVGEGPEGGEV